MFWGTFINLFDRLHFTFFYLQFPFWARGGTSEVGVDILWGTRGARALAGDLIRSYRHLAPRSDVEKSPLVIIIGDVSIPLRYSRQDEMDVY